MSVISQVVHLDVFSDVACPWCWIGKRRLERALASDEAGPVEVVWRAFMLRPDLPPEGVLARPMYEAKFGGPERVAQLFAHVAGVAATEGLEMNFDRMERAPNTMLAHRAVKLAGERADEVVEALFRAHFTEALDIGDPEVVASVTDVDVSGDAGLDEVEADLAFASSADIHAVPCFIADGSVGISGAHEPELLLRLIAAARERG